MATVVKPPILAIGDSVGVVAPSSAFDRASFEAGLRVLEGWGLRPRFQEDLFARNGYLAGDDGRRADELAGMLRDPDVRAIFAARGGYGVTRLLERHGPALMGTIPGTSKLLCGFSDLTALHAAWACAGVASLHGPVLTSLARVGDMSRAALWKMLFQPLPLGDVFLRAPVIVRGGQASGRLVGGNLSVLTHLIGTPYWPDLQGAILFLEDVGERPYRLDRLLTHLRMTGALRGLAAILLGDFTRCEEPNAAPSDQTAQDVLRERLGELEIPVLAGFPAGHGDECHPLPLGLSAFLDADLGLVRFEEGFSAR